MFADIRGQRIFFEDSGGSGPALLFSHGFFMDHTMFDPQVEALASDYRCVRWDERGFGQTQEDGKPFTYWDSADDGVGLLDHLGIESAVWIGMSQGGFLSLRAALAHPDRVRGLVLIDTASDVDAPEVLEGYRGMITGWAQGDDEQRQQIASTVAGLILGDEELSAKWIPMWLKDTPSRLLAPGDALLSRDDVTGRLGEIGAPAIVVHGTADQAITMERAEALCSGLRDCRGVFRVEGAAHAPNLTHPGAVNPHIRKFLDDLP